ncbi:hypothetical protein F7725_002585 [Dissostichus mawsoni]|uniref:Uncharacterized protein n=1 Tax=Dissostichus mawsoni TaxID=36200 RepID=A0A7J5Y2S4_DISMA|nr:hypothetical protein F7725_002585 [Dissostichus mawsoni]
MNVIGDCWQTIFQDGHQGEVAFRSTLPPTVSTAWGKAFAVCRRVGRVGSPTELHGVAKLPRQSAVLVPPETEMIIWTQVPQAVGTPDCCVMVENLQNDDQEWRVARTLSWVRSGRVPIRVCNPHPFSIEIPQRRALAAVSQVDPQAVKTEEELVLTHAGPSAVEVEVRPGHPVYSIRPEGKEGPIRTMHRNNLRPCPAGLWTESQVCPQEIDSQPKQPVFLLPFAPVARWNSRPTPVIPGLVPEPEQLGELEQVPAQLDPEPQLEGGFVPGEGQSPVRSKEPGLLPGEPGERKKVKLRGEEGTGSKALDGSTRKRPGGEGPLWKFCYAAMCCTDNAEYAVVKTQYSQIKKKEDRWIKCSQNDLLLQTIRIRRYVYRTKNMGMKMPVTVINCPAMLFGVVSTQESCTTGQLEQKILFSLFPHSGNLTVR